MISIHSAGLTAQAFPPKKPGQHKPNEPGYYARSAPKNPRRPETGLYRFLRGGYLWHTANECCVFARHSEAEMARMGILN